jgi:hypothetical protein
MSMAAVVILTSVSVGQAQAQTTSGQSSVDQDIALLRKDIRSDKKQIIAANMQLTDADSPRSTMRRLRLLRICGQLFDPDGRQGVVVDPANHRD